MDGLKPCPVILFCRGASSFAPLLAQQAPAAISLDWQCHLPLIRKQVGSGIALQGNLDPEVLLTDPQTVKREAMRLVKSMEGDPGFIFNLGHGILPDTPRENVEALISCLRS